MSLPRSFELSLKSPKSRAALWPLCLLFALTAGGCVDKAADTSDATDSLTDLGDGAGGNGDPGDSDPGSSDPGGSDTTSQSAEGTTETSASEDPIETADATDSSDGQPGDPGSNEQSSAETVDATGEHATDEASDTSDEAGDTSETSSEADTSLSDESDDNATATETEVETETASDAGTSSEHETRDAGACIGEEETCFPPQFSWTGFTVRKGWGPCPEPDSCFLRHHVSTDGSITIEEPEGTTETTLSDEDKTALFALLESEEFNTGMQEGFTCPEPPSDVGVSFELARSGVLLEQSVTGCAFGGTGPVQSINAIIDKY